MDEQNEPYYLNLRNKTRPPKIKTTARMTFVKLGTQLAPKVVKCPCSKLVRLEVAERYQRETGHLVCNSRCVPQRKAAPCA